MAPKNRPGSPRQPGGGPKPPLKSEKSEQPLSVAEIPAPSTTSMTSTMVSQTPDVTPVVEPPVASTPIVEQPVATPVEQPVVPQPVVPVERLVAAPPSTQPAVTSPPKIKASSNQAKLPAKAEKTPVQVAPMTSLPVPVKSQPPVVLPPAPPIKDVLGPTVKNAGSLIALWVGMTQKPWNTATQTSALSALTAEAVVQASRDATRNWGLFGVACIASAKNAQDKQREAARNFMRAKTIPEMVAAQNNFLKVSLDIAIEETARLTELSVKTAGETIAPVISLLTPKNKL
ncbi:hypothetical protein CCP2SC5_660009 [Azospirillaceae bacterium]